MILQPSEIEADHQLIQMCLYGDQRAWQALVDRYKRLVFSIARTYGGRGNADAIFKSIWQTALKNLENLGPSVSFRYWLTAFSLRMALNASSQDVEVEELTKLGLAESFQIDPEGLRRIEQEQIVRECIDSLPLRCRDLVRMLFLTRHPLPCSNVPSEPAQTVSATVAGCLHELVEKLTAMQFAD